MKRHHLFLSYFLMTAAMLSLLPNNVLAWEEEEFQLRPNPIEQFMRKALVGYRPADVEKLKKGKSLRYRAKRTFKLGNRGFGFRRGDVLKIKMGKKGAFFINDNDKTTKGIILHKAARNMGIVVIDRDANFKRSGRLVVGKKTLALGKNIKKMTPKKLMHKKTMHKKTHTKKMMH